MPSKAIKTCSQSSALFQPSREEHGAMIYHANTIPLLNFTKLRQTGTCIQPLASGRTNRLHLVGLKSVQSTRCGSCMSLRLHSTRAWWVSAFDCLSGCGLHAAQVEVRNARHWLHLVSRKRMGVRDIQRAAESSHGTDPSALSSLSYRNAHGTGSS